MARKLGRVSHGSQLNRLHTPQRLCTPTARIPVWQPYVPQHTRVYIPRFQVLTNAVSLSDTRLIVEFSVVTPTPRPIASSVHLQVPTPCTSPHAGKDNRAKRNLSGRNGSDRVCVTLTTLSTTPTPILQVVKDSAPPGISIPPTTYIFQ